jgi:hypothetical protein
MSAHGDQRDWWIMRRPPWVRLLIGLACAAAGVAAIVTDFGTGGIQVALVLVGLVTAGSGLVGLVRAPS